MSSAWSLAEVEAVVDDYFAMLRAELEGRSYSKASHRAALRQRLNNRSDGSVEFKHPNISAVLIELGFPYIAGYQPRSHYQALLYDVVASRLAADTALQQAAAIDVDRPPVPLTVVAGESAPPSILDALTAPPKRLALTHTSDRDTAAAPPRLRLPGTVDYLAREARNRDLGVAGELFVVEFERARLIHAGAEALAAKIEHTSLVSGDGAGFDILSYNADTSERLIEVKTTRYGAYTPFYVSRNEVEVSRRREADFHLYRLYEFRQTPKLYTLPGHLAASCELRPEVYSARTR